MFIEPLLLIPFTEIISNWYHPEIEKLINNNEIYKKKIESKHDNLEYYNGNLLGFRVIFDNNIKLSIIALTNKKGMISISTLNQETQVVRNLINCLTGKKWNPGGQKFIESEYGVIFNKVYSMNNQHFELDIFDDITIVNNGMDWWFI